MEILEKFLAKSPQTASRILEGEAVVVLPKISEVNILNDAATRIWELCDGTKKTSEIIAQIQAEYNADAVQIKTDSLAFIAKLVDQQMLVISDDKIEKYDS